MVDIVITSYSIHYTKLYEYITLPLLKPTTILVSIMSMLQCLKTFSTQYLFTQGGAPMGPINVITLNLYNTAIRDHRIGLASAMSIILFCIMLFFRITSYNVCYTKLLRFHYVNASVSENLQHPISLHSRRSADGAHQCNNPESI